MPIPLEYQDKSENQQPSDIILSPLSSVLMYGDERNPRVEEIIQDITLIEIDQHMRDILHNQDLPFQLVRIRSKDIIDEEVFNELSEHCNVSNVPYDERLKHKVYFVETASNAVVLIPIQLEPGVVNVCIELLDRDISPKKIYDMYMNLGKLSIDQIKFIKFDKK